MTSRLHALPHAAGTPPPPPPPPAGHDADTGARTAGPEPWPEHDTVAITIGPIGQSRGPMRPDPKVRSCRPGCTAADATAPAAARGAPRAAQARSGSHAVFRVQHIGG